MTGLILKLRPFESVLVNGAVIENGDRKTRLCIRTVGANVLRLRDAISEDEADTPLKRAAFLAQKVVAGELAIDAARPMLDAAMTELRADPTLVANAALAAAEEALGENRPYAMMRHLTQLVAKSSLGEDRPTERTRP